MLFNRKKNEGNAQRASDEETIARWREFSRQTREANGSASWPIPQASPLARSTQSEDLDYRTVELLETDPGEGIRIISGDDAPDAQPAASREAYDAELYEQEERVVELPPQRTAAPRAGVSTEEDLRQRFGNKIKSALGPGTMIEGKFTFDSPVRIDGTLTGEVKSTSVLIVGEQAVIHGRITVGTLVVLGEVYGDVDAADLVEIKAGGRLEGDLLTHRIVIEDGALFDGGCSIRGKD